MLDLDHIAVDPEKANNGTWVKWIGNSEFLIARYNNGKAEAARAEASLAVYKALQDNSDPEKVGEINRASQIQVIANHILLDWKNLGRAGQEIPFSREAAIEILSDPRYEDLVQFIITEAINYENFREENETEVVEDAKN